MTTLHSLMSLRLFSRSLVLFLVAGVGLFSAEPATANSLPKTSTAEQSVSRPTLRVECNHADWNYRVGEPVSFLVRISEADTPVAGAQISYTVGPEKMPAETRTAVTDAEGIARIDGGTLTVPGFVRCSVEVNHEGHRLRGAATAAFSPELIEPTQSEPADFDAFWDKTRELLAKLPIDARLTPMPEESTDAFDVFMVSLQNIGTPPARSSRFYGVLTVPRGEGPYPAMLIPPGAGIRKLRGQKDWASRGFITLEVGIHGVPVNLPGELYGALSGALDSYYLINLDTPTRYYFRRVIAGCLRSLDYLVTHAKWDGKNLIALGGSQGGYLTLATTALDSRVTACVVAFPAYCDVSGYVHGRAGGWPGLRFEDPTEPARAEKIATTAYFDGVNFARRIKVPGHYGWGYNDATCPPTTMFAAYNLIRAPKTLSIFKEMGHPRIPELTAAEAAWLTSHLASREQ
jgi:Acetyl esterase (deacetylase)